MPCVNVFHLCLALLINEMNYCSLCNCCICQSEFTWCFIRSIFLLFAAEQILNTFQVHLIHVYTLAQIFCDTKYKTKIAVSFLRHSLIIFNSFYINVVMLHIRLTCLAVFVSFQSWNFQCLFFATQSRPIFMPRKFEDTWHICKCKWSCCVPIIESPPLLVQLKIVC